MPGFTIIGRPSLCERCVHAHCALCKVVDPTHPEVVLGAYTLQPFCHFGGGSFSPNPLNPVVECTGFEADPKPRVYHPQEEHAHAAIPGLRGAGNGRTPR